MPTGQKTTQDTGNQPEEKKLDLSAAQVAGSSLATVAAALLASKMGVYGTILGAGVVSVVATAGGPVIQHFFRRAGDQLRASARPGDRQVPLPREEREPADVMTAPHAAAPAGEFGEEFGEATVHGTRVRGWKRTAVASGAAFVLAIGGLGTYEAMAGTSVSSDGGTLFSGGTRTAGQDRPSAPRDEPAGGGKGGRAPGSGTSPGSPRPPGGPSPGTGRGPSPDPSSSGSGEQTPGPSPSKRTPTPTPAPPTPPPSADPSTPAARQSTP
ncbi:hypothetical protein [Streptomyces sp. NBC_01233]|uniref:hypothetical protein n=1 Tax=Streptomyces sp. NBC_01233 TaxID=2903787 RepID=UPI002E1612C5|nr:hypothetical protein OG332_32875 [Streptomyces sp. NBC_01233]